MKKDDQLFHCKAPDLRGNKEGAEVQYPVSYEYNGGISIKDKWYKGFKVPEPILDPGLKIKGIGVGLELNATPPIAIGRLVKI